MATERADQFPNIITRQVTMSAADTITFEEVQVGLNIFDKAALVVSRIEYQVAAPTVELMTTSGDDVQVALTTSDALTTLGINQVEIVDSYQLQRFDMGTAGTGVIREVIGVKDFSTLGGGGILLAPKPLFFAMKTTGLASAGTCSFRFYFRVVRLTDAQYLELLETRRAFG